MSGSTPLPSPDPTADDATVFFGKRLLYAGIGARVTPPEVCTRMQSIGSAFARRGWTLRSGGQIKGADTAFENGHRRVSPNALEIFLPHQGFCGHRSGIVCTGEHLMAEAARHHPAWHRLDDFSRRAMARNVAVVLGPELDDPVSLVVCWTEGGRLIGGTAQALRMAGHYGIPIFNLGLPTYEVEPLRARVSAVEAGLLQPEPMARPML